MSESKSLFQKIMEAWNSIPLVRKAVVGQIIGMMTVAIGLAFVAIFYFSQSRVPMIMNEHQLIAKQMGLYLQESIRFKESEYAMTLQAAYPEFSAEDYKMRRLPKPGEVFLFKDKKNIIRLGADKNKQHWITNWKADKKIYDEARGAVYILNNGGEVLFSNVLLKNILGREPVKEFFDSGLGTGMRIYTSNKTKMISGFVKIPNSNAILFFENPLYGVKSHLMYLIRVMIIGGLFVGLLISLLTFRFMSQMVAPLREAELICDHLAQGTPLPELQLRNSPDFGGLIARVLMLEQRYSSLNQNSEIFMAKLRGSSYGVDQIRSAIDAEAALGVWAELTEKLLESTLERVVFYRLDSNNSEAVWTKRVIGVVAPEAQGEAENLDFADLESSITEKLTLIENPKAAHSLLSFLDEKSITERNGFTYFIGHQGKWVIAASPVDGLHTDPSRYLALSILISTLDLKISKQGTSTSAPLPASA